MARAPSPYYNPYPVDPATRSIGSSLARALFGDPAAAAAQAEARAKVEALQANAAESTAHAGYYGSQADGSNIENQANRGLPAALAAMTAAPAPRPAPPPTLDGFLSPDYAPQAQQQPADVFRAGLPGLIANLTQGGHGANVSEISRTLGAFLGDDQMARRALVAGGASPSEHFAITPERADAMAAAAAAEERHTKLAVEDVQGGTSRDVARINHANDIRVATINHASDIPVAGIRSGSGTVALTGNNPGGINDGSFARSQPGYTGANGRYAGFRTMADGENAQKALLRSYISRGYDTPSMIASRWAPDADKNNSA